MSRRTISNQTRYYRHLAREATDDYGYGVVRGRRKGYTKVRGGCWVYDGFKDSAGYALINVRRYNRKGEVIEKTSMQAARYFFGLWVTPIPRHLEATLRCGNRACIKPTHVDVVTHSEVLTARYAHARAA